MARILIAVLITLAALTSTRGARADDATISWGLPTQNTNGSTIVAPPAPGSLTRTTIEYGSCTGTGAARAFATKLGEMWVAPPATSLVVAMVVVQEYCFRGYVTNTFGMNSSLSNVAWKANAPPTPGGVTITVTQNSTAWGIQTSPQNGGRMSLYSVGTAKPATPCDCSMAARGPENDAVLCRIDSAAVDYVGSVRPAVVVASCAG